MICSSCFEGCLFCQAICFIDKIVQRIKFIHFSIHWTVTKFLRYWAMLSPALILANQTAHNLAFPTLKLDTISHPVNSWKNARPLHTFTPSLLKLSIISIFLSFRPLTTRKPSIPFGIATSAYVRHKITTSLSTVFTCTLVYPFFPRFITWRTKRGSTSSLLHCFMSVSDETASLLLIMESPNVTHNIDCLPSW